MSVDNKTGIFLTGGGGIGAFHIGFFKALEEANIKYDFVSGSSIGALVGGASTYLSAEDMYQAWKTLTLESVLKIDSNKVKDLHGAIRTLMLYKECFMSCATKDPKLMIDIEDIRKLLYASLDGDKIKNSDIDLGIVTTVVPSMKLLKIYKDDMKVNPLEYIIASLYLPIFSRERIIDGRYYTDISRFRRYPVEMLKEKECTKVYVVNIEAYNTNRLIKPLEKYYDSDDITFINYQDKPSILDFSLEQAVKNYRNGYETTMKVLERKRG